MIETAIDLVGRIRLGLGAMRLAHAMAKVQASKNAVVKLACVVVEPGGGGRVGAMFDADPFFADIERLCNTVAPPATEGGDGA